MAPCSICTHPQRYQIEEALMAKEPQQQVATRFGLGSRKPLRTQLQTRLATCQAALEEARGQLEAARNTSRLAVWKDDAVRTGQAQERVQQLEAQIRELTDLAALLTAGVREATYALAQAHARRKKTEQQHWQQVLPQLDDEFEHYCCWLLMAPNARPPVPPRAVMERYGPRGVAQQRRATIEGLKARYPVHGEEDLSHVVSR